MNKILFSKMKGVIIFSQLKGEMNMITILNGVAKFFVSNAAVIVAITLLPVFLITDEVTLFKQLMGYLFNES